MKIKHEKIIYTIQINDLKIKIKINLNLARSLQYIKHIIKMYKEFHLSATAWQAGLEKG